VYIHVTFFLLLAWIVFASYRETRSWAAAGSELLFVSLVFLIIVMHEYGHALAARRFGVKTRDITLLPIGGMARLERIPENPYQELVIAVAGPLVNVVLALACLVWVAAAGQPAAEIAEELPKNPFAIGLAERLLLTNVILVVFNMIPAFPMDGGRVLRAFLAMNMNYVRATQMAARVGQAVALGFALVALTVPGTFMLLLIAFFVWIGASQEAAMVAQRASLAGLKVRQAMITQIQVVRPDAPLEDISRRVLTSFQYEFPVLEDGRVVGIITRDDLAKALSHVAGDTPVSEVMQREFLTAAPDEPLTTVLERLRECQCHSLPVLDGPQLLGLITAENIGEMLMIRAASKRPA
jgi:Zn-dependent protease/CBS domain-containing protein